MSAQPQPKQDQQARRTQSRQQSTETRLAVVETRWEEVIPHLARREDIAELRSGDIAELQKDVNSIKVWQESQMRMIQDMKTTHERIFTALDAIHEMQGKFSADLRVLDAKIDEQGRSLNAKIDEQGRSLNAKIEAQTNKIIIRLGGLFIVILGAIEVASRLWPKV